MATCISEIPAHRPRALVVDDSQIARYILSAQLRQLGFEIEVADSAESAFRQIAEPLPDVVFMDHVLPGIDGIEAVSRLRGQSRTATLPVVMYTSQDSDAFAKQAKAVGANDIFVKTSDAQRLSEILAQLLVLPARSDGTEAESNVRHIGDRPRNSKPANRATTSLTRRELADLLEPSLEVHHSKLHQELLAEFAILERYDERMRRDLLARIDMLVRDAGRRIDGAFTAEQADRRRAARQQTWSRLGVAAILVLGVALSIVISWRAAEQGSALELAVAVAEDTTEASTEATVELQREVSELRHLTAGMLSQRPPPARDEARAVAATTADATGAAAALVQELQAMGILGPVRVETRAGSFCVTATPFGLDLVVANVSLNDCDTLPVQLTAASRR
jgi:CheY-like chemotaxis protein